MADWDVQVKRLGVVLRECVEPSMYVDATPLEIGVWQAPDPRGTPPTPAEAAKNPFGPVSVGWRWGPKWSTAWFRLRGVAPAARDQGTTPVLRFSSGTEALVWVREGERWTPVQGLDVNRDSLRLADLGIAPDGTVDVLIEAACNHPFGVTGFEWDDAEWHRRWASQTPGILERAELAFVDESAWELRQRFALAVGLLKELPAGSSRAAGLMGALTRAAALIEEASRQPEASGAERDSALALLGTALRVPASGSTTRCHAVGHAHIDTAWHWPVRETRRKVLRSFSNQLRLMERYPEYAFMCSQAVHYAFVEELAPGLFEQIRARVAQGRWEPIGGMWVEPDCNCPSGESLARQLLHADRYWRAKFGDAGEQYMLYLPDTFGFPGSLPQVMDLAGLSTFITNKLHWNASNTFPHTTWIWRGIDGTEVVAHNTPGADYNACNTPKELRRGEEKHASKGLVPLAGEAESGNLDSPLWLQPFGYGDGGGGATDWSIRFAQLASDCDGLPRVELSTTRRFIHALHAQLSTIDDDLVPRWFGELYLELHRGTLTSQAWIKQANRRAEDALAFAELVSACAPSNSAHGTTASGPAERERDRAALDKAWKLVLLNQFHDILPGSSIGWVYEDSRRDYARVTKTADQVAEAGTTRWLSGLSTLGLKRPAGVFDPSGFPRGGVVEVPGSDPENPELALVRDVPSCGVCVIDRDAALGLALVPAKASGRVLSNGILRAEIDDAGRVKSLTRVGDPFDHAAHAVANDSGLNQLVLYADRPHMWDAWDIDQGYERGGSPVGDEADSIEVTSPGPLRAEITVMRHVGKASRLTQVYRLDAGSSRLDVLTHVDWRERHTFLRALFPTNILATHATYDIQFGHVQRPTHRNTSWDAAMFEVCAHRWMDLSQPGRGMAILNDSKYGHSCLGGTLGLSLLRSPTFPDPEADQGEHEFAYAIMPHDGDWKSAGVHAEAEALNRPLVAYPLNPGEDGPLGKSWSPLQLGAIGAAGVTLDAVKRAEDDDSIVVRFHECFGGAGVVNVHWTVPVKGVVATDLLERPFDEGDERAPTITQSGNLTEVRVRPFQIVTLKATRATNHGSA